MYSDIVIWCSLDYMYFDMAVGHHQNCQWETKRKRRQEETSSTKQNMKDLEVVLPVWRCFTTSLGIRNWFLKIRTIALGMHSSPGYNFCFLDQCSLSHHADIHCESKISVVQCQCKPSQQTCSNYQSVNGLNKFSRTVAHWVLQTYQN